MARVIIVDAGPLIALAGIGKLELLRRLFGQICIPEAVKQECLAGNGLDAELIQAAISDHWLVVNEEAPNKEKVPIAPSLGAGESEAIVQAMQEPEKSLLILDDRLARRYALRRGLFLIGTARVLVLAETQGLIGSADTCIDEMIANGYRISRELLDLIRRETAGEG